MPGGTASAEEHKKSTRRLSLTDAAVFYVPADVYSVILTRKSLVGHTVDHARYKFIAPHFDKLEQLCANEVGICR